MEATSIDQIEDLAGTLSEVLAKSESPQNAEEAQLFARTLAILQLNAVEVLSEGLAEWTLKNGPVYIDGAKEQAYGQWEKKTTSVSDEAGLWELLDKAGIDANHHKRPDLVSLKTLATGEDPVVGIEKFITTDTSFVFGFKKNLQKRPRNAVGAASVASTKAGVRYGLGAQGVVDRARVVKITPGPVPQVEETASVPVCGVMPPPRVMAERTA
jgi:hypothetical protein